MRKRDYSVFILFGGVFLCLAALVFFNKYCDTRPMSLTSVGVSNYEDYKRYKDAKQIRTVYFESDSDELYYITDDYSTYKTVSPDYDTLKQELLEDGVKVYTLTGKEYKTYAFYCLGASVLCIIVFVVLQHTSNRFKVAYSGKDSGSDRRYKNLKCESTTLQSKKDDRKTFKDIAGLYELKASMKELVDFVKNPDKYESAGAVLPKGVILYGPSGTGKTLMAQAIAGECHVPFFHASGSSFVEKHVGVGASRVRELFETAAAAAPCIIFIDEVDALGQSRKEDGNEEYNQTVNQFLASMDGFVKNKGVLVIAATNRLDSIDEALLRPGRFSLHYCVPLPETVKERREIIDLYSANKKFDWDVDLDTLAKQTCGLSPAGIANILNVAAIKAVNKNNGCISKECIDEAVTEEILQGHLKKNLTERDMHEAEIIAYHEAAHAVIAKHFGKTVTKVSIVPSTSGAGGVTYTVPDTNKLHSKKELEQAIMELYAGRAGELLLLGDENEVTEGASNDIERASKLINQYLAVDGFGQLGWINVDSARMNKDCLDSDKINLAKILKNNTTSIVSDYSDVIRRLASMLMTENTVYEDTLDAVMKKSR